ncbi:hypothetical protein C8Q75DRAFT_741075 [Abortiporus biennis]|nr:hypothetical protein C8Q75DRAFT_741075 [Abortiporus biennis]
MAFELHNFQNESEWPESVQKLVSLLRRPLPRSQELASLPSMSPLSRSQLQRIPDETESIALEESKLSTMADLTLMTSAAIEQSLTRNIGPSRTIHHWFTLIRALSYATSEDADAFGDVSVVYPAGFGVECGIASMLVTFQADESSLPSYFQHVSEPKDVPSDENNIVFDERDSRGDSIECGEGNDNDEELDDYEEYPTEYSSENVSETTEEFNNRIFSAVPQFHCPSLPGVFLESELAEDELSDEPFIDLPLSGHILPGRCNWPSVPFPVLCLASDKIIPLVASAAYQRWAWNIDLPVVGFRISAYGSLIDAYVAWINPASDHERTPVVHVLCPDSIVGKPSASLPQGVFDLSNPQSSLKFAQFILSLDYHFDFLRNNLPSQRLAKFRWRSDDDDTPWSADIEGWRATVDVSDNSSSTDFSGSCSPTTPPPHLPDSVFAPDSIIMLPRPREATADSPGTSLRSDLRNEGSAVTSTQGNKNSCSAICAKNSGPIDGDSTITSLMLNRFAFSVARVIDWQETPNDPPEFCKMLDEYEKISCFLWPTKWREMKHMPTSNRDSISQGYGEVLFRQYKERDPSKVHALNSEFTTIMEGMLPFLMTTVHRSCITDARLTSTREAESRHYFDSMFNNFYHCDQVFLETRIKLSENTLLRHLKSPGGDQVLADLHDKRCEQWFQHTSDVVAHVRKNGDKYDSGFEYQCSETRTAASNLTHQALGFKKARATAVLSKLTKQKEPAYAVCDAFLACAIEISLPSDHARKSRVAYHASRLASLNFDSVSSTQSKSTTESKSTTKPEKDETPDPSTTDSQNDEKPSPSSTPLYEYPFSVHSGDYAANPSRDSSLPKIPIWCNTGSSIMIFIPVGFGEYKKPNQKEKQATNQARLYCIAAVRYLASIGITDYPIYVFATHGTIAGLMMGWYSSKNENTYIMERNTRKFDIRQPIQAFHLATVILRLKVKADELKDRVSHDKSILEKIFSEECKEWAMPQGTSYSKKKVDDVTERLGKMNIRS